MKIRSTKCCRSRECAEAQIESAAGPPRGTQNVSTSPRCAPKSALTVAITIGTPAQVPRRRLCLEYMAVHELRAEGSQTRLVGGTRSVMHIVELKEHELTAVSQWLWGRAPTGLELSSPAALPGPSIWGRLLASIVA